MRISINTNFPEVAAKLQTLGTDVGAKALASALNKTVAQAKTQMSKSIRQEFKMSAVDVRESLVVTKARAYGGQFRLEAMLQGKSKRGRSLNLIRFMEKFVSIAQGKKRKKAETLNHVFFQIKKIGGRKSLSNAFIGNKGRTVFMRTGRDRLPIKPVQTIGVPSMFNTRRINSVVIKMINDKFPTIFSHEAEHFIRRFNNGR